MQNPHFELLSEHACFGGVQRFHRHASTVIGLPMKFGLYLPPQALAGAPVPLLASGFKVDGGNQGSLAGMAQRMRRAG